MMLVGTSVQRGRMLRRVQTSRSSAPHKQSSAPENRCCRKRRKQGVAIYWQEEIIERLSTNEAGAAALINAALFAQRSILNVIYPNESICSRKWGIRPRRGGVWLAGVSPPVKRRHTKHVARGNICERASVLRDCGTFKQSLRLFAPTDSQKSTSFPILLLLPSF